jgi:hypothetical protein
MHSAHTERLRLCGMWLIRAPHPDSLQKPAQRSVLRNLGDTSYFVKRCNTQIGGMGAL